MANLPSVSWAQRSDSLFVTINVADVKDAVIELTETHLKFSYVATNPQPSTLTLYAAAHHTTRSTSVTWSFLRPSTQQTR